MPNPLAGSIFYARLGNAFTRPLWSLLGPPKGFAILTTTGRKTGKPRRQSVRAIRESDRIVVVAMMGERAQWLKNVRSNPKVTVRLWGETITGLAHAVHDEAERKPQYIVILDAAGALWVVVRKKRKKNRQPA